jgi:integrase
LAAFKAYDRGHLSWGRDYIDHETGDVTPAVRNRDGNTASPAIGVDTAAATRSFFLRRVLPVWGSRSAGSVTRQDVVKLLDTLEGFADARRKGKTRLSHFFAWTMDRNALVTANPAAGVQTATPATRERVLTDGELRAIWTACGEVGTFGAMVRTMILTMARRSEVSEMPRAELRATEWTIAAPRTKNGRPMVIHRTAALDVVLAGVPVIVRNGVESPFVFEGRHHNRPISGYSDWKDKLDALTGDAVAPWTLHDLRRTGASLMQRLGVSFEVREACLNHTVKGVAGVYARHDYTAEKRHAFEALAAEVARIVEGREESNVVPLTRPAA